MSFSYILTGIIIVSLTTFLTRAIPFVVFANKKPSPWLKLVEINLPTMIMIVLIFYAIKDVSFLMYPFGMPEIIGILVAIFLHVIFKHALFSIFLSTIIYMILIQNA